MARAKLVKEQSPRLIKSTFYADWHGRTVVKVNLAVHAERAVERCISHLRSNNYEALLAEVYDKDSSELHAVIKRSINGDITILYKRDYIEPEVK